jgi:hypothetical protein
MYRVRIDELVSGFGGEGSRADGGMGGVQKAPPVALDPQKLGTNSLNFKLC